MSQRKPNVMSAMADRTRIYLFKSHKSLELILCNIYKVIYALVSRVDTPPWYGPGGGLEASRWWAAREEAVIGAKHHITQSIAYGVA